jgi:membrane protein
VTALLFTFGKYLIGIYLGKASVGSAYGAAGSLVVVLVWVYYSAQVFFFGAEFTHVYAQAQAARARELRHRPEDESSAPRFQPPRSTPA